MRGNRHPVIPVQPDFPSLRALLALWPARAAVFLHAAWAVLLALLPLTNVLDYESALATAAFHGFFMPGIIVVLARRTKVSPLLLWPQWTALCLALAAIPLIPLAVTTLWNCPYGFLHGLAFWLLYPGITALFVSALFPALAQVCRRRLCIFPAVLAPWLFLAASLVRLYLDPPVFLYDPFFGFFSGAFYDRFIDLRPAFLAARAMHLAGALGAVLLASAVSGILPRRRALAGAALLVLLSAGLHLAGPRLGMRYSHADLQQAMGRHLDTAHFRIVHSPETGDGRVQLLAVEAEWHFQELAAFFGEAPSGRITVYLFADEEQKRRFFGTRDVEVAKPWQKAVYITDAGFPHPSLRHELAHVFAAVWGDPVFGVSWGRVRLGPLAVRLPDPGAIEGVAVAADAVQEDEDLHAQARLLRDMGGFAPFESLFSPAFYGVSSARAYVQAGSFLRRLYDTRGSGLLRRLYREGGPLTRILPDFDRALSDYDRFLSTVQVPEHQRALARERFLRPPIHRQRCVHAVARVRRQAAACAADREERCAMEALERAHRMDPGSLETWMLHLGISRRLLGAEKSVPAAVRVLELSGEAEHLRVRARLVLAEAAWQAGDRKAARAHLERALAVTVPPSVRREIVLMLELLDFPVQTPFFKTLFTRPLPVFLWIFLLESSGVARFPLLAYLAAGAELSLGRWADAARRLDSLDVSALPDEHFRCEALYRRFLASFLLRDFAGASGHLDAYVTCPVQEHNAGYYRGLLEFASRSGMTWAPDAPAAWH